MSFNERESSAFAGEPVDLFFFEHVDKWWAYTSAEVDITYAGITYFPLPGLQREALESSQEDARNPLKILLPAEHELVGLTYGNAQAGKLQATIRRLHRDDNEAEVQFIGEFIKREWKEPLSSLVFESLWSRAGRGGGRRRVQRGCGYRLFDGGCGLAEEDYKVAGTLESVMGEQVEVGAATGYSDGWFAGGEMIVGPLSIDIIAHQGSNLQLAYPAVMEAGQSVVLLPGCDHSFDTCGTRFSNGDNFGGQPHLIIDNPYDINFF